MLLDGIAKTFHTNFIRNHENMTADRYINGSIQQQMLPTVQQHGPEIIIMQVMLVLTGPNKEHSCQCQRYR